MPTSPTREFNAAPARTGHIPGEGIVNIGQSICIRGELTGQEDLTIEGKVEGKIDLQEHNLTIGPNGRIQAEVGARTVVVQGEVTGNIKARERVELAETGHVKGDIVSPRIVIADGARFKGSVDMSGAPEASTKVSPSPKSTKPTVTAPVITDGPPAQAARAAR
ncbi:MAG: polymer-forming cytoskeletal protein [Acidobacteriota bacterium]